MPKISAVLAREILDSRGHPTIEVEITTKSHAFGRAQVPSGASVSLHEAYELRDRKSKRYGGYGVLQAVRNVNHKIQPKLLGLDTRKQAHIDGALIQLDGTPDKSKLGANATLAVSLACTRAAADFEFQFVHEYLQIHNKPTLPVPLVNIMNGGVHAIWNTDIQEYWIIPIKKTSFAKRLQIAVEIYQTLKTISKTSLVGDEGGIVPHLQSNEDGLRLLAKATKRAGYTPGKDVMFGLDCAASAWKKGKYYFLRKDQQKFTRQQLIDWYLHLISRHPIMIIEDPFHEDDWQSWIDFKKQAHPDLIIVGDDLFATKWQRLAKGIDDDAANAILIKPNQVGTLTETMECIHLAHQNDFFTIISHRSGDTEDTFIADLAVATNSQFIKTGAPCRAERTAKYNQLLRIAERIKQKK